MKNIGMWSKVYWLLLVVFVGSISDVRSQDLFREIDQVKKEVSDLKKELSDLRNTVDGLRKALLKAASSPTLQPVETAPPKEQQPAKPEIAVEEKEMTKTICQAVGRFFTETDAAMRTDNSDAAEAGMRTALQRMNTSLQAYTSTHRASKLLRIYEGLAWDAYVAVELRHSVQGNQDLIDSLRRHKKKYVDTCPKQ